MTIQVTIMGHAGLFLEADDTRVLVDPILHDKPLASGAVRHLHPRTLELAKMPRPSLVIITHGHLDHFDPPSVELLPRAVPLLVPEDPHLLAALSTMGFTSVTVMRPWDVHTVGGLRMTATPSGAEIDEFGVLFEHGGARFWHMSDAEAGLEVGHKVAEGGRVDLVSVKYQPTADIQGQVFRALGASFDKEEVVEWLETACAARPRAAFPYASGITFGGRFAWNNRFAYPFREETIVALLEERFAGDGHAYQVRAGDVITLGHGEPTVARGAAPFVRSEAGPETDWEPLEKDALEGLSSAEERAEVRERVRALLPRVLRTWVAEGAAGPLAHFLAYGVIYQLTVHLGGGERAVYSVDFSRPLRQLRYGPHPHANYLAHVGGRSLLEVLRGEAGAELFHAGGDLRIHERILAVRDGRFWIPPRQGWSLYDELPEPLTWYLRHSARYPLAA